MYSQGEIEEAVAAGVLAPEQAAHFREFVAGRNATPHGEEEYVRIYRGYNDLFATYACLFALFALGWLGTLVPIGGRGSGMGMGIPQLPILTPLLVAGASWGLAEIFTRARKTALASILLAVTFSLGSFATLAMIFMPMASSPEFAGILIAASAGIAAAATWGYYQRFQVTIGPALAVGLGVIGLAVLIGVLVARTPAGLNILNVLVVLIGIGVAYYATTLDMKDPWRVRDANEIGFWMHGVASTALIIPLAALFGLMSGVGSVGGGIAMVVIFFLLTLVGLILNRKVYALATLGPLITGISAMTGGGSRRYGSAASYGTSPYGYASPAPDPMAGNLVAVIIISILLLLLAMFWTPLRRSTMALLPAGLRARLGGDASAPIDQVRTFE